MYVMDNGDSIWVSEDAAALWASDALQIRLHYHNPKTLEEFQELLDSGGRVNAGAISVWRCTPEDESEMRRRAEETQTQIKAFQDAIWGAGGEVIKPIVYLPPESNYEIKEI